MINPTRDLHPKHLGNMLLVEETLNFDGNKIKNDLLLLKCESGTETKQCGEAEVEKYSNKLSMRSFVLLKWKLYCTFLHTFF